MSTLTATGPTGPLTTAENPAENPTLLWDDLVIGQSFKSASLLVTTDDIITFAKTYDPQTMHTDPEAAKHTPFQTLVASGWHTLALTMKLMCEMRPFGDTVLVGLGGDEVNFIRPLLPNQTVHVEAYIHTLRASSNPAKGHLVTALTTYADGVPIISQKWRMIMPRRVQG